MIFFRFEIFSSPVRLFYGQCAAVAYGFNNVLGHRRIAQKKKEVIIEKRNARREKKNR